MQLCSLIEPRPSLMCKSVSVNCEGEEGEEGKEKPSIVSCTYLESTQCDAESVRRSVALPCVACIV